MQKFDIIIIGGGVVGLTLACLLAQEELSIALIDHEAPEPIGLKSPYDIRVNAIHHASQALFNAIGVWQKIQQLRVSAYHHMRIWDATSPAQIKFDHTEIAKSCLGYIVEYNVMRQALWQQLETYQNAHIYTATAPQLLQEKSDHITLQLNDGILLAASLLVGADGKNSWVAKQAFSATAKFPVTEKMFAPNLLSFNDDAALVTTLSSEDPHQQTALQRFLPTGPVALLPLADPNLVSLVWSTTRQEAETLKALPEDAFNLRLTQAMEYALGQLTVRDQRVIFPLIRHQAPHYVKPHIALVGDAAHTILPLAGQGLNLGLLDAACLAQTITEAHIKQREIGSLQTLRRYERWRKGENSAMLLAMEGFHRFFSNSFEPLRLMRHAGFELTQKLPWIKKYFMQRAMGLRGELPEKAK